MKHTLTLIALTAALAVAGLHVGTAAGASACTTGPTTFAGVPAKNYCGPASATITIGGKTLRWKGGVCERSTEWFTVGLGTAVLGKTDKPLPSHIGLAVGRYLGSGTPAGHDGTFKGGILTYVEGGKGHPSFQVKVTLARGRSKGTFSGKVFITGQPFTGTFRCS
jgi:hypothetical protein